MDLKEFVELSLTQMIEGVAASREAAARVGAIVNPAPRVHQNAASASIHQRMQAIIQTVEFDVAVTITTGAGKAGAGELRIASLSVSGSLGGQLSSKSEESYVSRVRFSVPVLFPPEPDAVRPPAVVVG